MSDGPGFALYSGETLIGEVTDISGPTQQLPPFGAGFLVPLKSATVHFEGEFRDFYLGNPDVSREIVIRATVRPAWWGRIKDRVTGTPPRTYEAIRTHAIPETYSAIGFSTAMDFTVTGPIESGIPPMSDLELRWDAICSRIRFHLRRHDANPA